ncbi:hypothetical protein STENM327S_03301 [Streptomyces tendae]
MTYAGSFQPAPGPGSAAVGGWSSPGTSTRAGTPARSSSLVNRSRRSGSTTTTWGAESARTYSRRSSGYARSSGT